MVLSRFLAFVRSTPMPVAAAANLPEAASPLSDLLNRGESYRLTDALIHRLDDGRLVEVGELELFRDDESTADVVTMPGHVMPYPQGALLKDVTGDVHGAWD